MLLRRLTQHVKDQNWFAVGLDFVIVVAGILIAFQITNWSEARKDRQDEKVFLQDLHDDIFRASLQSDRTEALRTRQAQNLESAVELVFSDAPNRELRKPECSAIAYSHTTYVGRAKLPSLIQLQTAGRTGIISDRNLARELAELTQRHEALDTAIREIESIDIGTKFTEFFTINTKLIPAAGGSGELERDAEVSCKLSELRANRLLLNGITSNADAYDAFMRDGFVPWVAQMKQVHERIDTLLGIVHKENEQ